MKKTILLSVLLVTFSFALKSEEFSPFYKFSIFGKEHFNTIGVIFDFPSEDENIGFYISRAFGFSFNEDYPIGIEVEYHFGKQIIRRNVVNKIGISGGVASMGYTSDSVMSIMNLNVVYSRFMNLDDDSYIPIYIGIRIEGGCGYCVTPTEKKLGPMISAGISIGMLF